MTIAAICLKAYEEHPTKVAIGFAGTKTKWIGTTGGTIQVEVLPSCIGWVKYIPLIVWGKNIPLATVLILRGSPHRYPPKPILPQDQGALALIWADRQECT